MSTICITRGCSFDPQKAKLDRMRTTAERNARRAEKAREAELRRKADERRVREEIRSCYSEHVPTQIAKAGPMMRESAVLELVVDTISALDFLDDLEGEFPGSVPALQAKEPVTYSEGWCGCAQPDCTRGCGRIAGLTYRRVEWSSVADDEDCREIENLMRNNRAVGL